MSAGTSTHNGATVAAAASIPSSGLDLLRGLLPNTSHAQTIGI
jgi:hypothetical protein